MEEQNDTFAEEGNVKKVQSWIQENLRIITSVFIVGVIAIGIYSYSGRSLPTEVNGVGGQTASSDTEKIAEEGNADVKDSSTDNTTTDTAAKTTEPAKAVVETPAETSRETETSFVETAQAKQGLTNLARKATANYLEKNADSSITAEHKIYIEDYLRKNVGHQGGVRVGTSVEFSKDLIQKAVAASKNLNERQLENLKKYSARVSEFRK
ncbi:MAG: hypothetical protein HGA31_01585 [Candidatus Moranbacteria bacterium]|nr:hypothetical protein [Candidatus Moranbacteria bacterium]